MADMVEKWQTRLLPEQQGHTAPGTERVPGPVGAAPYYPVRSPVNTAVVDGAVTPWMDRPVAAAPAVELAMRIPVPNLTRPALAPAEVYRVGAGEWTEYWTPAAPHPASVLWLQEAMSRGPGPYVGPELGDNWWRGLRVKNPLFARLDPPSYLTGLYEPRPLP